MKIILGIFFIAHGIAHLVGFLVYWKIIDTDEMPYTTKLFGGSVDVGDTGIRIVGIFWLLTALAFFAAGIGTFTLQPWWWLFALIVAVFSLIMSISGWPDARIGVFVNILIIAFLLIGGRGVLERSGAGETGVLTAEVLFQIEVPGGARDITFDADGNIYLFDYGHYVIRKLDPGGRQLLEFGGNVEEGGLFTHLMEIEVFDDRLVVLDSVARFTFDLNGELLDRASFEEEVICERPVVARDGGFIGEYFRDPEAKNILTLRRADGTERARLESYDLSDFIPAIKPGVDFFLNLNHMRSYRYGYLPNGSPVWASTDTFRIFTRRGDEVKELITGEYTPVPVPDDEIEQMRTRSESLPPPIFLFVPNTWRLIHKLFVGTDGDIWTYLQSLERTSFLRFSSRGREKAFYTLEAEFDPGDEDVVIREFDGRLWFMVPGRGDVTIYTAVIPR